MFPLGLDRVIRRFEFQSFKGLRTNQDSPDGFAWMALRHGVRSVLRKSLHSMDPRFKMDCVLVVTRGGTVFPDCTNQC
jgi:hypothetical protein